MKKFLVLYCSPKSAEEQMNVSPEEMKKNMEPWTAWFEKAGDAVVDMGAPIGMGVDIKKDGEKPSETWIRGYSIMQGEDIEEVKNLVKDNPQLQMPDAFVQVLETMPMEM